MFLDGPEILLDLKILWELALKRTKLCEILSHSVRYGMYALFQSVLWCNFNIIINSSCEGKSVDPDELASTEASSSGTTWFSKERIKFEQLEDTVHLSG